MKKLSFIERLKHLTQLQSREFDLLIIGGGITGVGTARDAAARGMSVALIEGNDFASGTSSRSSKLIHGGIRYLENMEFKLVFEALNERTKLFEMAPHLVHHLRFMLPLYEESRVGMAKMGLGMWLYDALALFQAPEMHERLDAGESLNRMPALRAEHLKGSYIYSDGYMDDDRLVHETLRAANELGAVSANFVRAIGAVFENEKIKSVRVRDEIGGKEFEIRARHIVSSVGPWTDELGHSLFKQWKDILRPTKGIHLTLPKNRLPLTSAVVMAAEKSNRIVFGIPRHDMIIIGTTDTDYKGSPDGVVATKEDVDYLLDITGHYFPGARLKKEDLIASYAGVRPLVQDGSSSEGKTSREHTIFNDPRGITFVAGGKYTTYRLMAQQIVDHALRDFTTEDRVKFKPTDTAKPLNDFTSVEAYHQSHLEVERMADAFQRPVAEVRKLAERYGMEAERVLARGEGSWNYWQLEAAQAIDYTMCLNLVDFYRRRVPLFLADPAHGLTQLEAVVRVFEQKLKWNDAQARSQKDALKAFMQSELTWKSKVF